MDAHESDRASENPRPPSNPAENNDGTNHHGRSKSSWGLSTAVHAVHGVGFVAKKVINNRLTDSLWHSRKSTSNASVSSDASDTLDEKLEDHPHETVNQHTSQPSLTVSDEQTPKLPVSNKPAHERQNTPLKGINVNITVSDVIDRLHDLKHQDGSDGSTTGPTVGDRSENAKPTDGPHVKPVTLWPSSSTTGSNVRKVGKHLWPGTTSSKAANQSENLEPPDGQHARLVNQHKWPRTVGSNVLASRTWALNPARGASPKPARGVSPTPARGASPKPARGVSPTPARGVSPTPTRGVGPRARDVSPPPVKHSGRRHFLNANILSVFTRIVDTRKEKNVVNQKEVAQYLELLYNIQVQWQFANASAEAALNLQRATAEKSLFDAWRAILDLRDSLALKKIDIDLIILQLKLYAVLYRQMAYIDEWASIQKEHESALFATTNDLQARSLSLPITGGVKADINALKLLIFTTIQVLQATISCIQSTLSKLDKTHVLASELANLVLHERALLDECEIFLASAAPLHIEECSLRSYLMQSNGTSMTE